MLQENEIRIFPGTLYRTAYLFLFLPWGIFLTGYLRPAWCIPLLLLLASGVFFLFRTEEKGEAFCWKRSTILLIFAAAFLTAVLAGQGGYLPQKYDHHWRNAILGDMILGPWPVSYGMPEPGKMVYYFLYWMVPAAAGKLFMPCGAEAAVEAGHFFLLLWTGSFLFVIFLSAASLFRITDGKKTFLFLLLFLLFSGMDYPGFLIRYRKIYDPAVYVEWWNVCQYSCFYTQLAWVFNQALPAWLCTLLCLRKDSAGSRGAVLCACFAYAPLPAVGLGTLMICVSAGELLNAWKDSRLTGYLKNLFSPGSLLTALSVLPVSVLFFLANGTVGNAAGGQVRAVRLLVTDPLSFGNWLLFILLEFFLLGVLVRPRKRESLWVVAMILLSLLPLVRIVSDDFCMRVSIPPLLVLFWYTVRFLREEPECGLRKKAVLAVLLIGAVTPLLEIPDMIRCFPERTWRLDGIRSFGNQFKTAFAMHEGQDNFVSGMADRSLFFRYLAKEGSGNVDSLDNRFIRRIFRGEIPEAVLYAGDGVRVSCFENWIFVQGEEAALKKLPVCFYLEDGGKTYFGMSEKKEIRSLSGQGSVLCIPVNRLPGKGYLLLSIGGQMPDMPSAGRCCRPEPGNPVFSPEKGILRLNLVCFQNFRP